MSLDPEQIEASRMVVNVYPKARIVYKVTTRRNSPRSSRSSARAWRTTSATSATCSGASTDERATRPRTDIASAASDNELVKLVNKIIIDAYQQGASDIHIEPYPGKAKTEVRFRHDGALMPYIEVPASYRSALAARIKIMCDLDISERRKPQDGKIKFKKFGPLDIELRVATIPTAGGVEDIVMRILAGGEPIPLDKLALRRATSRGCKAAIEKPYGLFFVCGPTGSGKTTTLHSVLGYLNTPDTKIWTAEDPVEITQKGLRQVQVNRKAGLDFATVMKAFLRADPDIIMVGEMRDKETVSIGIEASLTGHLVFATLHTNSAPESIVRLLDMGMDPFNFADALLGILAQRLAKRLCKCKESYNPAQDEIKRLLEEYCQELLNTSECKKDAKPGSSACTRTSSRPSGTTRARSPSTARPAATRAATRGYKGRLGLHELLVGTDRDQEADPGARARGGDARDRARRRHAHAEAWTASRRCCRASPTSRRCARSASSKPDATDTAEVDPVAPTQPRRGRPRADGRRLPVDLFQRLDQLERDRRRALAGARHRTSCWRRSSSRRRRSRTPTAARSTASRARGDQLLQFEIVRTDTLDIAMGGTTGNADPVLSDPPLRQDGKPEHLHGRGVRGAHRPDGQHRRRLHRGGVRLLRHAHVRREDRLPLALVPDGADEEPRGRDHRRAAAHQREDPDTGAIVPFSRRGPAARRVARLAGGDRAHQPRC